MVPSALKATAQTAPSGEMGFCRRRHVPEPYGAVEAGGGGESRPGRSCDASALVRPASRRSTGYAHEPDRAVDVCDGKCPSIWAVFEALDRVELRAADRSERAFAPGGTQPHVRSKPPDKKRVRPG